MNSIFFGEEVLNLQDLFKWVRRDESICWIFRKIKPYHSRVIELNMIGDSNKKRVDEVLI